LAAIGTFVLHT